MGNNKRRAQAHAKHDFHCICGRIVWGNGARAMHFYVGGIREQGYREGHRQITRERWLTETEAGREHMKAVES